MTGLAAAAAQEGAPASPMAAEANARTGQHVAFLDGLRGLAVLIVFFSHASAKQMSLLGFSFDGTGKSGVYLFFVLSSFLITSILLRGGARLWTRDYLAKYFARRFFRVYPLFFAYVVCALVTTPLALALFGSSRFAAPFPLDLAGAVEHWLLLRGDGVSWSIPVEMKFYLVSPFLAALLLMAHRRLGLLATGAAGLVAALGLVELGSRAAWIDPAGADTAQLLPYLPAFVIGATLALALAGRDSAALSAVIRSLLKAAGWLALVVLVLTIPSVYAKLVGHPVPLSQFHGHVFGFAVLWSLVLAACWAGDALLCRFFVARPLRFLGMISFSFYLTHPIVLELCSLSIGRYSAVAGIAAGLVGTTAVAWLSYRLFERPILDKGTAWVDRRLGARIHSPSA